MVMGDQDKAQSKKSKVFLFMNRSSKSNMPSGAKSKSNRKLAAAMSSPAHVRRLASPTHSPELNQDLSRSAGECSSSSPDLADISAHGAKLNSPSSSPKKLDGAAVYVPSLASPTRMSPSVFAPITSAAAAKADEIIPLIDESTDSSKDSVCIPNGMPLMRPVCLEDAASPRNTNGASPLPRKHSPGSHSLASTTSAATVVAAEITQHNDTRAHYKQTVGDILLEIDSRAHNLCRQEDFTTSDTLHDMQFLAHQSRYSSDMKVKKRLVTRMVERGILEIFIRVFKSVHSVDYLEPVASTAGSLDEEDSTVQCDGEAGAIAVSKEDVRNGLDAEIPPGARERKDSVTSRGSEFNLPNGDFRFTDKWPTASDSLKNLRCAIAFILNATERSPLLCEESIKRGVIRLLLADLADPQLAPNELNKDQHRLYIAKGYLGILNNIIRFHNEARDIYRDAGAVKVLQQYLKSSLLMVKTKTLMLLSYVINESENDIINSSDRNLSFMCKMFQTTVESENHHSKKYGYWAVEVAAALNRLSSCGSNKERVARKATHLYVKLLQGSCAEEQIVATQGLWSLAFNDLSRQLLREDSVCMDALENLARNSAREEIKRAARGCLWVIEGRNSTPRFPNTAAERDGMHLLLSYQWATRPIVLRIRDKLREAGYRVWVDVDCSGAGGLESFIEAIDRAVVVLFCITQKYKDSPSCRTEAEYTWRHKKEFIPLRLQPKFNPDGWLGHVIGSRMCFDFSKEGNMELMLPNLIRELGGKARVRTPEPSDGSSEALSHSIQGAEALMPINPLSKVATWTELDVARWLKDNDLPHVADRFRQINGELLLEIHKMKQTAPESFYVMLRTELQFNFIATLRFTKALSHLGQS